MLLTQDIIIPLFLTDDHALLVTGDIIASSALNVGG